MDWKQIKKNNPKAFKKFVKWLDCDSSDMLQFELMMILKNERDLYDFFDEMGIIIGLDEMWTCWIYNEFKNGEYDECKVKGKSRNEVETRAFKKSFNILEKL